MRRRPLRSLAVLFLCTLLAACHGESAGPAPAGGPIEFALVIHGGAGVISREIPAERRERHLQGLREALSAGRDLLEQGGTSLDAVEQVVRILEDNPLFNAGKGAVFNHEGSNELDASIMDGKTLACGAVAGVRTVKNPIVLARRVMEQTRHILLSGDGAEAFADAQGVDRVEPSYFFTQARWDSLERVRKERSRPDGGGTVGAVALDRHGNLAAATSTGGLTDKMYGRVGDSPIIGAGTYADNATCAVSGTGRGEEYIRHGAARRVASLMSDAGLSLTDAAGRLVHEILAPGDGGIIAVSHDGEIAMTFNTPGMFRGAADSAGRFEVGIWDEVAP